MNADETEVFEFLKQYPHVYVSAVEISKNVGDRRNFLNDRTWTRPVLRRMEMEGILESNISGEYRIKDGKGNTTTFRKALEQPGMALGDTTIIVLDPGEEDEVKVEGPGESCKSPDPSNS